MKEAAAASPGLRKVFLVHGEERAMFALAERTIVRHGGLRVILPERGKTYEV